MTHEPQQPLNGRPPQEQESFCPYCMSRVAPGQSCPVCGLTQGAYTPAPHHLPLGTILAGRYLVGRALGEGGFGITYIGCDLRLEMKVAIKEYFPVDRVSRFAETSLSVISRVGTESQDYDQGLKRFLYEARTMARMEKQPQIVMVRDYFEANHTAYIVMEYVEGTNFMQLTAQRGGRIAAGELLPLIEPLFSALSAVHAAGLIHRDISPDNLMLERGSVRLLDFGCARESARGTETMTIALKQGYAPIEQYQRKGQGPWTDVYALSATIYYCLTGKVPPQSLDRILEDELIPPRDLGVELSPEQQDALLRGMEIQPRRRYQTVEELHAGLYRPAQSLSAGPAPVPAPEMSPAFSAPAAERTGEPTAVPDGDPASASGPLSGSGASPEAASSSSSASSSSGASSEAAVPDGPPETAFARRKQWIREHKRLCAAVCGSAAAVLLLLTPVLSGALSSLLPAGPSAVSGAGASSVSDSASGDSSASGAQDLSSQAAPAVSVPDRDVLFAGAAAVTTPEEFTDALADDAVSAILCEASLYLQDKQAPSEQLEITKPVLISQDCELISKDALVLGEGGVLWVQGKIAGTGCLYTNGGILVADAGSTLHHLVCLKQQADLVDYGAEFVNETQVLTVPEQYDGAVTVTNGSEFRRAAGDSKTTAIRVDGPVELLSDTTLSVPVLVTENGSITAAAGNRANLSITGPLINYGTVSSGLQLTGDGARLVNYGRIEPSDGLWLGDPEASGTEAAFNLGTIAVDGYSVIFCDVINIGTLSVEQGETGGLSLDQGLLFNYGRIETAGNSLYAGSRRLFNNGVLHIAGSMELMGFLRNNGSLTVTSTGAFRNNGLIDGYDYDGVLTVEDGGALHTENGVLISRSLDVTSNEGIHGHVRTADFSPIDGPESVKAFAADAQELLDALADPGVDAVIIEGDVTLSEDLHVSKPVYVQGGFFTLENGAALTVSGTIFCANGRLYCDALTLENGAMMELIGEWFCSDGSGSVRVTGKSWLFTRDSALNFSSLSVEEDSLAIYDQVDGQQLSSVQLSGGSTLVNASQTAAAAQFSLTADENSHVIQLCDFSTDAGTITLRNSSYTQCGSLSLGRVTLTIGEESAFSSLYAVLTLGPQSVLENRGLLQTVQSTDFPTALIRGTLNNSGTLVLSGTTVEGTLSNEGRLCTTFDRSPVTLSNGGRIIGDATVLLAGEWEL